MSSPCTTRPFALAFLLACSPALAQAPWSGEGEGLGSSTLLQGGAFGVDEWDWSRSDSLAPAGVRYSDTLPPDVWMLHLRYGQVKQDGLRDNTDDLSDAEVFDLGYTVAPQDMTTDQLDLELLYGVDPCWTVFAEVPWLSREMDSRTEDGDEFTTEASGIGDVKLGAIRILKAENGQRCVANIGVSLPTGSIDEKDGDQDGADLVLPYSQQLGTGTYDLYPGITWMEQKDTWTWGAQGQWRIHLGRNDEDWARSDEGDVSVWIAKAFNPDVSGSLRVRGYFWGDVHGSSDQLDPDANPLNDRKRQGGERYDLVGGLSWHMGRTNDTLRTLNVEVGKPVIEWLDGPGLSTDVYVIVGWRYAF